LSIDSLYEQARAGDEAAERQLFEQMTVRFRLFAFRRIRDQEESKGVVQDAMVRIITGYREQQFDWSFASWAYTVLKHEVLNHIKKVRRRQQLLADNQPSTELLWRPNPDLEMRLSECLRELVRSNRRYARILNFKHQGYDTQQICGRMNINPSHLYVIHSRAKQALKACLEREGTVS
jgi:RNA polymerase sigma factor (sigma-70 family)